MSKISHLIMLFLMINIETPAQSNFKQKNTHFSHTQMTDASPETIWNIWIDVENWSDWDEGLKSASLEGTFTEKAKGKLIPDKGPKSKFTIQDYKMGQEYTLKTKIPLGSLNVRRYLEVKEQSTYFTHEVYFKGPLKGLFGLLYGKRYRKLLPDVLKRIQALAEQKEKG